MEVDVQDVQYGMGAKVCGCAATLEVSANQLASQPASLPGRYSTPHNKHIQYLGHSARVRQDWGLAIGFSNR